MLNIYFLYININTFSTGLLSVTESSDLITTGNGNPFHGREHTVISSLGLDLKINEICMAQIHPLAIKQ